MDLLLLLLQIAVALGILNVWLLRAHASTPYRGGAAKTLREEFQAYGLSETAFKAVGVVKVVCAAGLLIGVVVPALVEPAAIVLSGLMIGALAMHVKVKDPLKKSLPAASVLVMCLLILGV